MENLNLGVKQRTNSGTASSRRSRSEGILPGILYGSDDKPLLVEMELHSVERILHQHASDSVLVDIDLDGVGKVPVLMKEIQYHPVTSAILHVDLQRVVANKPIQVDVSVELKGEAEGVKAGGLLDHVLHNITVQSLPADLVEIIEVDVSDLEIGDSLFVSDLNIPSKITSVTDSESLVVAVNAPKVESAEEEISDEGSEQNEPEVITEKVKEED
ncbi:MAG: 50S ribosomal protein L25 [Pontiellaceae bacterium]